MRLALSGSKREGNSSLRAQRNDSSRKRLPGHGSKEKVVSGRAGLRAFVDRDRTPATASRGELAELVDDVVAFRRERGEKPRPAPARRRRPAHVLEAQELARVFLDTVRAARRALVAHGFDFDESLCMALEVEVARVLPPEEREKVRAAIAAEALASLLPGEQRKQVREDLRARARRWRRERAKKPRDPSRVALAVDVLAAAKKAPRGRGGRS